jgi:hypothetical protein
MLQDYKGFLIDGSAKMIHPFYPESYPTGVVCKHGRGSSIVQVGCFKLQKFKIIDKDLAAFFGLELAKMVVDHCLPRNSIRN